MEEIKVREHKLKQLNTNKIIDRLDYQTLEYEIKCLKDNKPIVPYETIKDKYGYTVFLKNRPTPFGISIKTKRLIKESGLEKLLDKHTFKNFKTDKNFQEHLKQKAIAFAKQPKGMFIIVGQTGSGKTHLSTAICGELLFNGYEVRYMKWVDEIEFIKAIDYKESVSMLNKIKESEVLYIDDFLKSDLRKEPTPADIERAFAIIDYRCDNKLITIISTEMTYEQIDGWNSALAGRIIEMARENFIVVNYAKDRNYRKNFLPKGI